MKEKSLLIITPYFAPQTHAAVFRAYKLAKYLPRFGWKVHVLTVGTNYMYNENPELVTDLPESVSIHHARYIEPTLRGVRMALGGKNRTFKAMKSGAPQAGVAAASAPDANRPSMRSRMVGGYQWFLKQFNVPDPYWTWKNPAIKKGLEIIRNNNVGIIMTSSLPFTTLEIGAELKRRTGVKWVADFRDPMAYDRRLHSTVPRVFAIQHRIERQAVEHADRVTTLTSAHPLILADFYGPEAGRKARFIPTGLDSALIPATATPSTNDLIFVGEFLQEYGDEFFRVLAEADKDPAIRALGVRMKIVGPREINEARVRPLIRALGLEDRVEIMDQVPQKKLYEMIQSSRAAVLCTSRYYPWWTSFAKLVDYIALKKPVLAIVPDPSEARKWLTLTRLGVFLDGGIEECARRLREFLNAPGEIKADEAQSRRFLVENQVEEFNAVFSEVVAESSPR